MPYDILVSARENDIAPLQQPRYRNQENKEYHHLSRKQTAVKFDMSENNDASMQIFISYFLVNDEIL